MYSTDRNFVLSCAPRLPLGALPCFRVLQQHSYTKWKWAGLWWMLGAHSLQWLPYFFSLTFIFIHYMSPYNFHIAPYSDSSRLRSLQSHTARTKCNENHWVSFFNAVIPCQTWGLGERRSDNIVLGKTTYQLFVGKICLCEHRPLIDTPLDCYCLKCMHFFDIRHLHSSRLFWACRGLSKWLHTFICSYLNFQHLANFFHQFSM
jgi:hypothetical protein